MPNLEIIGFELSKDIQSYIKERMGALEQKAPATSHQFVHLAKVADNMYKASIKVSSSAQSFFVEGSGQDVQDLLQNLSDQMVFQFDDWKKNREFCS